MEYLFLGVLGWIVLCSPALIFAAVANGRRRRENKELTQRITSLTKQLEVLEHRLDAAVKAAHVAAQPAAAIPQVRILSETAVAPLPAATPATAARAVIPSFFSKCGSGLADAAQFCAKCGTPVRVWTPTAKPPEPAPVPAKETAVTGSPVAPVQPTATRTHEAAKPTAPTIAPPPPPPPPPRPPMVSPASSALPRIGIGAAAQPSPPNTSAPVQPPATAPLHRSAIVAPS